MLASPSVPLQSDCTTAHTTPSNPHPGNGNSAQHSAKLSNLTAQIEQLKADKQALLTRPSSTQPRSLEEVEDQMAKLDTEVGHLQTEKQLLIGRLATAEKLLAEARTAVDQKEGHLQGLQVGVVICPPVLFFMGLLQGSSGTTLQSRLHVTKGFQSSRFEGNTTHFW